MHLLEITIKRVRIKKMPSGTVAVLKYSENRGEFHGHCETGINPGCL